MSVEEAPHDEVRLSALDDVHRALGATFTNFAGWRLPLRFTNELAEHHSVRRGAGLFDISHMGQLFVDGPAAAEGIAAAVVSDITRLAVGRARYTMLCDDGGGVLDDLIVYRLGDESFLVIANASNTAVVVAELRATLEGTAAALVDRTAERALLSLQGPASVELLRPFLDGEDLPGRFRIARMTVAGHPALVARTGYTGEDGVELSLARDDVRAVWEQLLSAGATPVGLAARDSLRLEAALPLYGHELDRSRTPYDVGFDRIVDLDHEFVGRAAMLENERVARSRRLVGLVCEGRRTPRQGSAVLADDGREVGVVTSGCPSPTLGVSIAMAFVDREVTEIGTECSVDVRGRPVRATVTGLPFLRSVTPAATGGESNPSEDHERSSS